MLKDRKLKGLEFVIRDGEGNVIDRTGDEIYGYCKVEGYYDTLYAPIKKENIIKEIDDEEFYLAEVSTSVFDSDYHTYAVDQIYNGIFMAFNLNHLDTMKYFGEDYTDELISYKELVGLIKKVLNDNAMLNGYYDYEYEISVEDEGYLKVTLPNKCLNEKMIKVSEEILDVIRDYYSSKGIHITRMFGSYVLLKNVDGKLNAIKATPIPIKYCPLMVKLLKEVGGENANNLLKSLENTDKNNQTELMCELINKVVIAGGYFDTNRQLNSCEANVLFGASETIYSAFLSNMVDAAVIVSNNLGTIITTNASCTQGAVKRMTGLFYTSPNENIVKTAYESGIIPVFPNTAEIDQLEGVRKAISLGYKNIAVSVASFDNLLHKRLAELEEEYGVTIYKFGLCSTGIDRKTADIMKNYADVIWSCASKQVKEVIEPNAIAQVGVKIPVHIMSRKGWEIVRNHLKYLSDEVEEIPLQKGEEKKVLLHNDNKIKVLSKKQLRKYNDCPYPCI